MNLDKDTELFLGKILGIDIDAERVKREEEFKNYSYLLATMTEEEFAIEIARHFGENIHQAAIITMMFFKIRKLVE